MKTDISAGILGLAVSTFLFYSGAKFALELPVVQMSHPQRTCTSVMSPNPKHSCQNLPTQYAVQWVSERH